MITLGISEDLFDAGVTLCDGDCVVFAANEERYTRRKNEGGFPHHTLHAAFAQTGIAPEDVRHIYMVGHATPPFPVRLFPWLHNLQFDAKRSKEPTWFKRFMDFVVFATPVSKTSETSRLRSMTRPLLSPVTRRQLPRALRRVPMTFIEHHTAHAAAAWGLSGFDHALCITADGMGDGLSLTVSRCSPDKRIQRLWTVPAMQSFGLFFEALTEAFGFTPCRDEGKLTGLAGRGNADRVERDAPFTYDGKRLQYHGPHGPAAVAAFRQLLDEGVRREDLAAWAQHHLEEQVTAIARDWLDRTRETNLVLAGGIFANVSVNRHLHELPRVEDLFVCPNMGDGGLGIGAIWEGEGHAPKAIEQVFWGDFFSDSTVETTLKTAGLPYEKVDNMAERLADLLLEGKLVARFNGAMEWGPRALGNRSILAQASETTVVQRLNNLLQRNDFMPFAPAMLLEEAPEYLLDFESGEHAAAFMTTCFRCTPAMKAAFPAVVHVDNTARAQLVTREGNPDFHAILAAYKERKGHGVLLNTSFNVHEEPIVRTPEHAIQALKNARLDYLAIGAYLVTNPDANHP